MKATPEYKEEFLERLDERMIHSPNLEINNDLMKLFDDLALKWSTGMQSYLDNPSWDIYHENTVYSLVDGGYADLNYCIKNNIDTIRASEVLSWFEEDEEQVNSEGCLIGVEGTPPWEKDKGFEDILKKTLEKRENRMTYAEQQLKRIAELEEEIRNIRKELKFEDENYNTAFADLSTEHGINGKEGFYIKAERRIYDWPKFRAWADKMFSPVESEE